LKKLKKKKKKKPKKKKHLGEDEYNLMFPEK